MTADEIMQVREIIRAIFWSYEYNREISYMIDLCQEVRERVNRSIVSEQRTDDGNIIFGMLVILWGDYGTSPRSGWLENKYIDEITGCIDDFIEEYKQMEVNYNEEN